MSGTGDQPRPAALRVAHVVLSLDVGGLERVVLDLVREGRNIGQQVEVVCLERPGALAPQAEAMGAAVRCVNKQPGLRPGMLWALAEAFAAFRSDVVHTHQVGALLYAGPAARRAGVPVVVHTEHGKHFSTFRKRLLGRLAMLAAARVFCVSRDIAGAVVRGGVAPASKVAELPNGIDTAKFARVTAADAAEVRRAYGIPDGAPVVGTVGRLNDVKRQDVLVRGFAALAARLPDAHLLLVGDGPRLAELKALAEQLGVAPRVHFAGYQARPERLMAAMDVFTLTSESEGMPLSVLEAWAAGLAVVGSRVGGLPELIREGQTGRLFPFPDHDALAAVLHDLLTAPAEARRMGEAGRDRVDRLFGARRMAADYAGHYANLLAAARRPEGDRAAKLETAATGTGAAGVCP